MCMVGFVFCVFRALNALVDSCVSLLVEACERWLYLRGRVF